MIPRKGKSYDCSFWVAFFLAMLLIGCSSPQNSLPSVSDAQSQNAIPLPRFLTNAENDYIGLKWWQTILRESNHKVSTVEPLQHIFGSDKIFFDQVAIFSSKLFLLLPRYPLDPKDEKYPFLLNLQEKPVTARRIHQTPWPKDFVSDGSLIKEHNGMFYELFHSGDVGHPLKIKAVEFIDPTTQNEKWLSPERAPRPLLENFLTAHLQDGSDQGGTETGEEGETVEGSDGPPAFRCHGPWVIRDWKGNIRAKGQIDKERVISDADCKVSLLGNRILVTASTAAYVTPEQKKKIESDPSVYFSGGMYGSDRGEATIYTLRSGAMEQKADKQVLRASELPPLTFIKPYFKPYETREALVLPNGAGVVYTWRGQAIFPQSSTKDNMDEIYNQVDRNVDSKSLSILPEEILDLKVLLIRWRNGKQSVVDFQMAYSRKELRPPHPDRENRPTTGSETEAPQFSLNYAPQYVWTLNENGIVQEKVVPLHPEITQEPFYVNAIMRLCPANVGEGRYLAYFKGNGLWTVDLQTPFIENTKEVATSSTNILPAN